MRVLLKPSVIIFMLMLLVVPVTLAQRDETFVSPDEDWQITFPNTYEIEVDRDNIGVLVGEQSEILLYSPAVLDELGYTRIDDGQSLLEDFADEEGFEFVALDSAENVPGLYVALLEGRRDNLIGIAKTFSDDSFGLATVAIDAEAEDDVIIEALTIVGTFDVAGSDVVENGGGSKDPDTTTEVNFPDELRDFDADWEDAIAELEDEGLVAPGGELIYFEDSAFIEGSGGNYTSLARRASVENIVMAGELTFTTDGREYQTCSLAARVETESDGSTNVFTEFGVNTEDELYVYDSFGTGEDDTAYFNLQEIDHEDVYHYLVFMIDDKVTMYLNGELVANDVEVVSRAGSFGVLLRGDGPDSRCEVRNTWAYSLPRLSTVCEVTSSGDINKREGPGTDFDRAGQLRGNTPTEAVAFADGDDGFIWYLLEDDSWVREDLVTISGPCDDLPED
jgi:hypothetical protein